MKVDVYPNITNVEVYENPISVPVEATWEKVVFTVADPVETTFDLGRKVATDRDGDYVIQVHYNATVVKYGDDFTITGTQVNWVSEVALASGEEIIVWYSPKSAYGSVPGSGEVTSLTHLNDVNIEGPLAGQLLVRDGEGQFVNQYLTAGENVTITSNGEGITIASSGNGGGGNVVSASTITEGTVRLATLAESSGASNTLAVTPAGLNQEIDALSIPSASTDLTDTAQLVRTGDLDNVATSGDYNDLNNLPAIPSSVNDLTDVSLSGNLSAGEVLRYSGAAWVDSTLASTDLSDTADLARLASPNFTGNVTAPTPAGGDDSTKVATTEYVQAEIAGFGGASAGNAGILNVSDGSGGFNAVTWEVSNNHLLPTVDDSYDIGSATKKVRDIYIGANSLKIGDNNTPLGVDANGNLSFGTDEVLTDATLATVATSGQYADLIGAPTLSNVATSGAYGDLTGAPTLSTVATSGAYGDLSGAPTLSTVATSGAYADLSGTPTVSTVGSTGQYADLLGTPTLSTVATSGSYNDLSDKPAIPSASTDLTDTTDLARLASPSFSGTPTAPTPALGDDSTKIATTAYVQDEITNLGGVNSLDDLSDVTLSGALTAGEVLRYSGTAFVDSQLASTDLSDTADLARLAAPAFTGNPTASTPTSGDNSTKLATTAYVQTEITNMSTVSDLNDLTDVTLSGTSSAGEVLRYSGTGWVDSALASTDLSDSVQIVRTSDVGTAASHNVGSATGEVVELEDVSGSAGLPAVDASQLTGITAAQVGALANINNESLNDLSDVDFTAGASINGYVLTYNDTNSQWEALAAVGGDDYTVQSSSVTVATGQKYIVPPSVTANVTFTIPLIDDAGVVEIINLSDYTVVIKGTTNYLFTADGTIADSFSNYTRILFESKGTITLVRDKDSTINGEWYAHFHYPIESVASGLLDGDALVYEGSTRSFKPSGINPGEYVMSADVGASLISSRYRYVTAYDETVTRDVEFGNPFTHTSICEALDGRRVYFENRGDANLTISADTHTYNNGIYYRVRFYTFDGVNLGSGTRGTLLPGESAVVECVYDSTPTAPELKLFLKKGSHIPERLVETDSSATDSTIVCGTELNKLVYVDNGATAVTMTVPDSANLRDGYELTLKVLGTGAVTVARSGTNTFDGDTSLTLGENDQLTLIKSASGWAILVNDSEATPTSLVSDTNPTLGADLDVSTFDIVSSSGNNIEIAPDGSGSFVVKGNATGGSAGITLNCEANTHGVTIKSPPHASAATYTLTLPDDTGNANELLKTDGSGGLSWSTVTVGGNDVIVPHTGVNYSALNTDHVTTHLSAIDTALGNVGGGGWTYSAINSSTSAQVGYHYSCDTSSGAFTLTAPALSGVNAGQEIRVKLATAGNDLTVATTGSDTIDGLASFTLNVSKSAITLVANTSGTDWEII